MAFRARVSSRSILSEFSQMSFARKQVFRLILVFLSTRLSVRVYFNPDYSRDGRGPRDCREIEVLKFESCMTLCRFSEFFKSVRLELYP